MIRTVCRFGLKELRFPSLGLPRGPNWVRWTGVDYCEAEGWGDEYPLYYWLFRW